MTTPAHTPWPFRVVRFQHNKPGEHPSSHIEYDDEDGSHRLTLHIPDALADEVALMLNAHEDLLAACEAAKDELTASFAYPNNESESRRLIRNAEARLRTAIAKARGES